MARAQGEDSTLGLSAGNSSLGQNVKGGEFTTVHSARARAEDSSLGQSAGNGSLSQNSGNSSIGQSAKGEHVTSVHLARARGENSSFGQSARISSLGQSVRGEHFTTVTWLEHEGKMVHSAKVCRKEFTQLKCWEQFNWPECEGWTVQHSSLGYSKSRRQFTLL